ncbi:MAG TPA: hypothetical protein VN673_11890 [Clostridia bacterium]|nr:hypothetical protein [Clostridia bacterium]
MDVTNESFMSGKTLNYSPELTIRRLLRNRSSNEYFTDGGWTKNASEAKSFSDVVEAATICAQHGLNDVELALRYSECAHDVFCTPIR